MLCFSQGKDADFQIVRERGPVNYPNSESELKWPPLKARSVIAVPIVSSQRCVEIVLLTGRC